MNITKAKNINVINFLEKHEKGLFLFLTILFCSLYYFSYTIHNIPYTNGWGNAYADLVFSGKFPYRDFYYYLPPLNLIIDCILWGLSYDHLFVYVLFRFLERLIIICLAYNLLCKFAKPRYVCIGVVLGSFMFAAQIFDLIGDYNQTTLLLALLLTMIYIKYVDISGNANSTKNKKEYLYLLLGGFVIGLSFLHKQTIFLAECVVFFIVLTVYFIINRKKEYIKSVLITLLGIMIPFTIATIILLINNAFIPFINQVYLNVESKGSILSIMTAIVTGCAEYKCLITVFLVTLFSWFSKRYLMEPTEKTKKIKYLLLFLVLAFILFAYIGIPYIKLLFITNLGRFIIFNILLFIAIDFIIEKYFNKDSISLYLIILLLMFILICHVFFNKYYSFVLYNFTAAFQLLTELTTILTLGSVVLIIYLFYSYYKTKEITILKWVFALSGGLVYEYNASMGTSSLANYGTFFLIATLVTFLLSKVCSKVKFPKYAILSLCVLIPITCMSQKVISAYSWWGWKDTIIDYSSYYTIDVPGLEGFRVSENVKNMYEEMYKVVKSNTNEESVIYGFPHIRIFNVLLKNTNMNHFVPVPFYDVCSDDYIRKDIERLKETPPEIIVWVDIPYCMYIHERTYRNGEKLEQRKFQEWLAESVNEGKYTLIGQYDSMFIYKLNDGTEVNYTYYKNVDAVNKTLFETSEQNKE